MATRSTDRSTTAGATTAEKRSRRFGRRRPKDPNKPSRMGQIKQVYGMTARYQPRTPWILLGLALLVLILFGLIGWWLGLFWYFLILGLPVALLAATFVLGRLAERAAYAQVEGQPGQGGIALQGLGRSWYYTQEPVAAEMSGKARGVRDMRNAGMVFRAVGKPGVVLVSEGPRGAAARLVNAQRRHIARVAGDNVPVHVYEVGAGEQQLAVREVIKDVKKQPKRITKAEAEAVHQRLTALGDMRQQTGLPKGVDPNRMRAAKRSTLR